LSKYACVDVGTTRLKLGIYDEEFTRIYSEHVTVPLSPDGLHDPEAVYATVKLMLRKGRELGATSAGLATYRASVLAWKKDGTPLTPIVTWLNTESKRAYEKLPVYVKAVGIIPPYDLVFSPYTPLTRFAFLKEKNPDITPLLKSGEAMEWTLESYLIYRLTGRFLSDASNATMTGLVHPKDLRPIGIAKSLMGFDLPIPEVIGNAEPLGTAEGLELRALAADQQAACIAEGALEGRVAKITNGTGTFVDVPVEGYSPVRGLVPIVIAKLHDSVFHGLEGRLPSSGKTVDLMFELGVLKSYSDLEGPPPKVHVNVVPALTGLQIPNVPEAKGLIYGITTTTERGSLVSGLLDSIAFHVRLVLETSRRKVNVLRADGNLSQSTELLRRISAVTGLPVERQSDLEGTMRGLAILQALSEGSLRLEDIASTRKGIEVINESGKDRRDGEYREWTSLAGSLKNFRI
jgi:glycerol kinase